MKKVNIFRNVEDKNEYFVEVAKDAQTALELFEIEYPELKGHFTIENLELIHMSMCLDCETFWVNDGDYLCGDCGEHRLSKRYKLSYWLRINPIK